MNAKCHKCARPYLVARGRGGELIRCRSCGALNDASGAAPPVLPAEDPSQSARRRSDGVVSGPSVIIGPPPKPIDPTERARQELRAQEEALRAREASLVRESAVRRQAHTNRAVLAIGVVFAFSALLVVGGLFAIRQLGSLPEASADWRSVQLAVPQVVGNFGARGSGFVTEFDSRLWLVTNYHVIEAQSKVDILFRDPRTGGQVLALGGIATRDFRVHARFLEVNEGSEDGRTFDLAAYDIEKFRPTLEREGVRPLAITESHRADAGARVMAFGHPGSDAFTRASPVDRAAEGIATHSMFEGIISAVRSTLGRPTLVQTTAPFAGGCSGGPLVLASSRKVVGVNTWSATDARSGGDQEGFRYSLAAEQVIEVIEQGHSLANVQSQIVNGASLGVRQADEVGESTDWQTFPALDRAVQAFERQGWSVERRVIIVTSENRLEITHRMQSETMANALVLAIPRERSIDIDIMAISGGSHTGLGDAMGSESGALELVGVRLPNTEELVPIEQGVELQIPVVTYFLGEPVPARCMLVVMERPVGSGPTAGAGSNQPGSTGRQPTGAAGPAMWQRAVPRMVQRYPDPLGEVGHGSGFVTEIGGSWWLVTNEHVLGFCPGLEPVFFDESIDHKEIVRLPFIPRDRFLVHRGFARADDSLDQIDVVSAKLSRTEVDLLQRSGIQPLALAATSSVELSPVCVIGHPKDGEDRNSVTSRTVVENHIDEQSRCEQVQIDAGVDRGNLGGPIIDQRAGEVIGVVALGESDDDLEGAKQGLRFGTAAQHVREIAAKGVAPPSRAAEMVSREFAGRQIQTVWVESVMDELQYFGGTLVSHAAVSVPSGTPFDAGLVKSFVRGAKEGLVVIAGEIDVTVHVAVKRPDGTLVFEDSSDYVLTPELTPHDERLIISCTDSNGNPVACDCLVLVYR